MKKLLVVSIGLIAALFVLHAREGFCAASKLEKAKLKIGVSIPSISFLPLYVAAEEKLFQEEGLEVELLTFKGGTENTQALMSNSVDFIAGAFLESVLNPVAKGMDVKMFYGFYNYPSHHWYSKLEIKSIKDAKGKKFS